MAPSDTPFPVVPLQLLERLKKDFPDKLPLECPTEAQAADLIGQQRVIRKLDAEYRRQQNNILTPQKD